MKTAAQCLSQRDIDLLLAGTLGQTQQLQADEHLSKCAVCQRRLENAAGDGKFWEEVSSAIGAKPEASSETGPDQLHQSALLALLGPTDDPQMLGRIGSYEICGLLGQGGMGAVFKALDPALNRFVALKILLPHLAASPAARARFLREGRAAAAVVNQHVLPIHAVDEYRGVPYLVMQYVRGETLQRRISCRGPLELTEILRIGLQVARGLAAAHSLGIIHRDVKPSNILLNSSGQRAWLSDFGLARASDDASITRSGQLAGTPEYMSPEQVRGESLDPRSDLFSLGSVLWTMAAGFPPFRAESPYAVLRRIADESPVSVQTVNPQLPGWVNTLIAQLMARRLADRPQSAAATAELLQQCLRHLLQPQSCPLPNSLKPLSHRIPKSLTGSLTMGTLVLTAAGLLLWTSADAPETPLVEPTAEPAATVAAAPAPAAIAPAVPSAPLATVAAEPAPAAATSTAATPAASGPVAPEPTAARPAAVANASVQPAAPVPPPAAPQPEPVQPAAIQPLADGMKGSTTVGGFKVELVGTANVKNMDSFPRFRRNLDQVFQMQGSGNFSTFGDQAQFNFPGFGNLDNDGNGGAVGGGGFAQAGGGGFAQAGGGGGAGGTDDDSGPGFNSANFGIALNITETENGNKRRRRQFAILAPGTKVTEQDGETADSGTSKVQWAYGEFEKQFPGAEFVYVERLQNPNRVLKSINGELKVYPGQLLKASFNGSRPQRQKVNGEEFVLQKVEQNQQGIQAVINFPPTTKMKQARDIMQQMQAMMVVHHCVNAEIEDSAGNVHPANGRSSSGTGGGSSMSFSFNGVPQGQRRNQQNVSPNSINFRFPALPEGTTIKHIHVSMADLEGEATVVPFVINVEPIPAKE
jgi:serine/threonine-protein kinase